MDDSVAYLYTHRFDPEGSLWKILEHVPDGEVSYGEDGVWSKVESGWTAQGREGVFQLIIHHDSLHYDGPDWPRRLEGMRDYLKTCRQAEQHPEVFEYLDKIRFCLAFHFSPAIAETDDPRLEILLDLAAYLDAVIYDTGSLCDPHGAMLLADDRDPDPDAQLPDTTIDRPPSKFPYDPPTAKDVIGRLRVVLLLAQRGWLELDPAMEDPQGDWEFLMKLAERPDIVAAALPGELEACRHPLGELPQEDAWQFLWLCEGSAVLAWALQLIELPPYDERVPITFLLENAPYYPDAPDWSLCDATEINDLTLQISVLLVRLKKFAETQEPTDFYAMAAQVGIDEPSQTLTLARINHADLELGDVPISLANEELRRETQGILVQRQEALAWLLGIRPSYSPFSEARRDWGTGEQGEAGEGSEVASES